MKRTLLTSISLLAFASFCSANADTLFDDFNVGEGHFNGAPNASGTSAGFNLTTSTADRIADGTAYEGAGFERIVLNLNGTTARERFLSGSGTPANNVSFTVGSATTDGILSYWVRTTASGWTTGPNLDSTANTSGTMLGAARKTIIADGQWHQYSFDLDSSVAADWGQVQGIGGYTSMANALAAGDPHTFTFDSIYFYAASAVSGTATLDLDYVTLTVPEPSTLALALLGGFGFLAARLRRR